MTRWQALQFVWIETYPWSMVIVLAIIAMALLLRRYPKCPPCNPLDLLNGQHRYNWFGGRAVRRNLFREYSFCREHGGIGSYSRTVRLWGWAFLVGVTILVLFT